MSAPTETATRLALGRAQSLQLVELLCQTEDGHCTPVSTVGYRKVYPLS